MASLGTRPLWECEVGDARYRPISGHRQGQARRKEPTHFIALPVVHFRGLGEAFGTVHAALPPHLAKARTEAEAAHITLGVFALENAEGARAVGERIGAWAVATAFAPVSVELGPLDSFKSGVLYMPASLPSEAIDALRMLRASLQGTEGFVTWNDALHVTVAKVSAMRLRARRKQRDAARDLVCVKREVAVGPLSGVVGEVQLCAMAGRRRGEYYKVDNRTALDRVG